MFHFSLPKKLQAIYSFTTSLLKWHKGISRNMPWKETKDPYKIWISEIILQQTRVAQGLDYYISFVKKFPDIASLAKAPQEDVLKAWEGLGYYSRARNLQVAAQDIMVRFNGIFPKVHSDILSLKGIGPYTAAAIASFAFDDPYSVVDGNVQRVLSRHFEITDAIDCTDGKKKISLLAQSLIDTSCPAAYNQAIMDFGALVCTPKSPKCGNCPLSNSCLAIKNNIVNELPLKSKKVKVTNRFIYYFLKKVDDKIIIQQREQNGIWAGLYEFPIIESNSDLSLKELKNQMKWDNKNNLRKVYRTQHKLTHLKLYITLYQIDSSSELKMANNQRLEKVSELSTFAFPKPLKNFLDSFDLNNI